MDLAKLELLIKKINTAVKTINDLKSREQIIKKELDDLQLRYNILKDENASLKGEMENLRLESRNHQAFKIQFEDKIMEILKYLPDDEPVIEPELPKTIVEQTQKTDTLTEKKTESIESYPIAEEFPAVDTVLENPVKDEALDSEEKMLKDFVQNQDEEEDDLFAEESGGLESTPIEDEEPVHPILQNMETPEEEREMLSPKHLDMLIDDEDSNQEITFDFEEQFGSDRIKEELPKGVL